jgi:2-oxoacid:acceptor oxidoreductase delta subunit (pyruvate/2-ketoisovalerate family)
MTTLSRGAVAFPGSSLDYRTGSWREKIPVHRHAVAPCHGGCPAGEDPQAYIAHVQEGNLRLAFATLVAANPLPAVMGRVCPHPCETGCNRRELDQPIAIHAIERHLGDEAIKAGWPLPAAAAERSESIAVVGGGPAGLSAAYHLRRRGFQVTIFDQNAELGGMLRYAIPAYRLPRDVLDAEIARILATGVRFEPRRRLGRDIRLDELRAEHAAVFLAPGCQSPREWGVEGAETVDSPTGLDLLLEWLNLGRAPAQGKRIVVHGGGNTAVDVARILRFAGAAEVHIVAASYRPDDPDVAASDRMAAFPREVTQAAEEGIIFHPGHTLSRLIVRGGHVTAAEITAVGKVPGRDRRVRRVTFEGTENVIPADLVVPAIGEVVDPAGFEMLVRSNGFIAAGAHGGVDGNPGLFAGGDALGNRGTVTAAIGDGRQAAIAIERYLSGDPDAAVEPAPDVVGADRLNLRYFLPGVRHEGAVMPVTRRAADHEIESGLAVPVLREEAARCLSCGNCLACDNCWTFCPEPAVLKTPVATADGSRYLFDYDYCKGCGICARECPTGFIRMEDEPAGAVSQN